MSLVGRVGRKRPRARLALALLYLILTAGAVTTLYPFVLMVSTGLKSATDQNDNRVIPAFLNDDAALTAKYVDDKYAGDKALIASTRTGGSAPEADLKEYDAFLKTLPADRWQVAFRDDPTQVTGRLSVRYHDWLRKRYRSINDLNKAYVEENLGFQTVPAPTELLDRKVWKPVEGTRWSDWREFKASLPTEYRIPIRTRRMFQVFLAAEFRNQFKDVPPEIVGSATKFEEISLPSAGALWEKFKDKWIPDRFRIQSVDTLWSATGHGDQMPIEAAELHYIAANAGDLKREFAGRNYLYVLDYVLLNGRAVWNTVLFCFLAIATQLIVNPIAAYALSRYPIRASGQILIFLLATMAFPAEVAMIPSFLLLKSLGLLNTFAALVLPGAASGYMIFLLKGFFDSLPPELFEAGQIDGAPESVMMVRIAFPLSRPVLGYLALLAFMGAYGTFMYAFLVVQDQRMWTLTVWLYQLQTQAPKAVVMAGLTLAAIPTLVVFLAAQRVILKGIVLPGER